MTFLFLLFLGGSFWERQRDSVFVLDGNCSSCGDCSDWKETLLVLSFRSSFVGATWCQSTRSLRIFGSSCTGVLKKLREFFGDHQENMSFVVVKF